MTPEQADEALATCGWGVYIQLVTALTPDLCPYCRAHPSLPCALHPTAETP